MSGIELLQEQADLRAHAARITAMVVEQDGSARADAYAVEHRLGARVAAYKAAGGVL